MIAPDLIEAARAVSLPGLIGATVELGRQGRNFVGLCPFHSEKTPSFHVYDDHYHCFGCGAHGDAIHFLRQFESLSFAEAVAQLNGQIVPEARPATARATRQSKPKRSTFTAAMRCWDEAEAPGEVVSTYLCSRGGLRVPEGAPIRFHPHCQRGSRDTPGGPDYWPAMLALTTDALTGEAVGVHRTYLLPDGSGKAPVVKRGHVTLRAKSILGSWGVVGLVPDEEIGEGLGIAEGIETALAVMQRIAWGPVWAVGPASILRQFPVLPGRDLTIFADGDEAGIEAARMCARRWVDAGAEVITHIAPGDSDWLDAVLRRAA